MGDVTNIWDRSEFSGLSPADRTRLAVDGELVRCFVAILSAHRRGERAEKYVWLHDVIDAMSDARSTLESATGRGVTIEQLADALGLTHDQARALLPHQASEDG